jgi:hypothetical protein
VDIIYNIKKIIPDKMYIRMQYFKHFHRFLNLKNPKTFNEKLQWLKLYERRPQYTMMVDKYEVRKYIAEKIGEEYLIPLHGVWENVEDINFDSLPNQFVLKCTHDSGSVIICRDKLSFNIEEAKTKISKALKKNAFYYGREWPYKNVKPRVIAEKYMVDETGELRDYKVHNFNGVPKVILICSERFAETGLCEDFYNTSWEKLDLSRPIHKNSDKEQIQPNEFYKMIEISQNISKDISFVRVDFYSVKDKLYFGEITLFPASGMEKFEPGAWDDEFGSWIKLPIDNKAWLHLK